MYPSKLIYSIPNFISESLWLIRIFFISLKIETKKYENDIVVSTISD